jgi:hypothetical protein
MTTYKTFVFREKDCYPSIDLTHRQLDEHREDLSVNIWPACHSLKYEDDIKFEGLVLENFSRSSSPGLAFQEQNEWGLLVGKMTVIVYM